MRKPRTTPPAPRGEGGALAHRHSTLGMTQRAGILRTKAMQPLLTDAEIAAQYGVSANSVAQLLASAVAEMQPVLRTYAHEVGEEYLSAVLSSAADGRWQGPRAFLVDSGAIPRQGADNRQLSISISAPPGTPGYSAATAPPMLADVYDTPAGPPLPEVEQS